MFLNSLGEPRINVILKSNTSWQQTVSRERLGSIVAKILKNGILIPIGTSKESDINVDFKYKIYIKFTHTQQKFPAWVNLLHFQKRGNIP